MIMNKPLEYLENLSRVLDDIRSTQLGAIEEASEAFATALEKLANNE